MNPYLELQIQQLIDKHRCEIDGFFTDSRKAASDIISYLLNEHLLNPPVIKPIIPSIAA